MENLHRSLLSISAICIAASDAIQTAANQSDSMHDRSYNSYQ